MHVPLLALVSVGILLALCVGARGSCPAGELSCDNGECISSKSWCNENKDCVDESDESYCIKKRWFSVDPNKCEDSHFLCDDGRCVPLDAKCNGHSDCKDGTDEDNCDDSKSKEDELSEEDKESREEDRFEEDKPSNENFGEANAFTTSPESHHSSTAEDYDSKVETTSPEEYDYKEDYEEDNEDFRTAPSVQTTAESTTKGFYEKKMEQSTQRTYSPNESHFNSVHHVTSFPQAVTTFHYTTTPLSPIRDSWRSPGFYSQPPPADLRRTANAEQRPYVKPTPFIHRAPPPHSQEPPYSHVQPTNPPRVPPPYSQRPPYSHIQPTHPPRVPPPYSQGPPYSHVQPTHPARAQPPYSRGPPYSHVQPTHSNRAPPPYSQRPPYSHVQPTHPHRVSPPYSQNRRPGSYPHSETYPQQSYSRPQSGHPRTHEVQTWPDTRLASSAYTGRRKSPSGFLFPLNHTQIYERDNGHAVKRGKEWLIGLRDVSGGWGANTSRALVALALVNNDFVGGSHENDLMKKYLKVHLGVKFLSPQTIGPNQLAGHVNAILATCQDPRDFHGADVVGLLKEKAHEGSASRNPFVLLSLCLANVELSTHQVNSLIRTLAGYLPRNEREKDQLSLSISAFACHLQRYVTSTYTDSAYLQTLRSALRNATSSLLQMQLEDGSFGSVYSTALAAQALLSLNDSLGWDPKPTFRFILDHQTQDGSFGDFLATYLALPALSGRSLLHLVNIRCHKQAPPIDLTPQEILAYRGPKQQIRFSLQFEHPLSNAYSVEVFVPHGTSFFDVMRVAEHQNKHFNFLYEEGNAGINIYSISNVPNDVERGMTWQLYVRRNSETGIPRKNEVFNGDIRELLAIADQHYVFWYRPVNM